MKKLTFLIAGLFTLFISQAQTDSTTSEKQENYNASMPTLDDKTITERLVAVNDSQVVLAISLNTRHNVPAENIKSFTPKRKNGMFEGALIGLGIGAFTGAFIGMVSDVYSNETWFAMSSGRGALYLGISGTVIGAVVGAVAKKKFTIGGKKEKFRDLQAEIMTKLVTK